MRQFEKKINFMNSEEVGLLGRALLYRKQNMLLRCFCGEGLILLPSDRQALLLVVRRWKSALLSCLTGCHLRLGVLPASDLVYPVSNLGELLLRRWWPDNSGISWGSQITVTPCDWFFRLSLIWVEPFLLLVLLGVYLWLADWITFFLFVTYQLLGLLLKFLGTQKSLFV